MNSVVKSLELSSEAEIGFILNLAVSVAAYAGVIALPRGRLGGRGGRPGFSQIHIGVVSLGDEPVSR